MKKILCSALVVSGLSLGGCVIDPYTGEQKVSKTAVGAVAGAAVGVATSSKKDRLKGAAIGGALGAGAGYYFDRQEKILREKLQNTGVSVTRTENGIILNMPGNISFESGKYSLLPSFFEVLNSVALVLKEFDETAVKVAGHTDSTGSFEMNQTLSENRANAVANYLSAQGVARTRMHTQGYGPRQPIASNDTASGRAANRRVEIMILNP